MIYGILIAAPTVWLTLLSTSCLGYLMYFLLNDCRQNSVVNIQVNLLTDVTVLLEAEKLLKMLLLEGLNMQKKKKKKKKKKFGIIIITINIIIFWWCLTDKVYLESVDFYLFLIVLFCRRRCCFRCCCCCRCRCLGLVRQTNRWSRSKQTSLVLNIATICLALQF